MATLATMVQGRPSAAHRESVNSQQDYVTRRMALWDPESAEDAAAAKNFQLGVIAKLPIPLQIAFRRKMLAIFCVQLFMIGVLVALYLYVPALETFMRTLYDTRALVAVPFGVGCLLLLALYYLRNKFPLNWITLLAFTLAESFFFAGIGVAFDTRVGIFNCIFTFSCVFIMMMLSGVWGKYGDVKKLMSPVTAGAIAYILVTSVCVALYFAFYDKNYVTGSGFLLTLLFQFVMIVWFANDAAAMYEVMSPDEYMQGVIYFYTDLICIIVIGTLGAGLIMVTTAMGFDTFGCGMCYCSGDCCYDPNMEPQASTEGQGNTEEPSAEQIAIDMDAAQLQTEEIART